MPTLKTAPVVKCSRCGKLYPVHVVTYSDPEGKQLAEVLRNLNKLLCSRCVAQKQYYIDTGRGEAWEKGVL